MKPRVACSLLLLLLVAGCASGPVGPLVALPPPDVTGPHARSGWATEIWVGPDALGVRYPALHRDRLDGVPADQPSLVPLADGRLAAEDVEEGKAPALRAALDAHAARVRAGLVGRAAEPSAAVHLDAATPLATLGVVLRTAAEAGMHRVQLVLARRAADLTMPMAASGPPSDAPHDKVDLLLSRVDGGWMAALSERPAGQPLLVPRSPDVLATIRTGNLPARVPTITAITHQPAAVADTWLLAAALTPESEDARVILDRQGRVVWYHLPEPGLSAPWAQAVPGEGLLFNQFDGDFCEDVGEVWCLDLSGELRRSTRTTDGHHTFVQHDDGTLAWIAVDRRSVDGFDDPVCGDRILELAPGESEPREVYSTWDDLEPGPGITQHKPFYCDCLDWTHANMLSWEAEAGRYLFSLSALDTILEIDRDSGEQVRSFGRLDDSWSFADGEGRFNHQHGSHYTDDGTLLLTWSDELTGATQATEYALDPDAGALEVVWAYAPAEPLPALALGEAHRLDGGNTLVNFGSRGALHEVASDGTLLWEATLDVGYFLGRTVVIEDLYALEAAD